MTDILCAPLSSFESEFHGRSFAIDEAASLALSIPEAGGQIDGPETPRSPWMFADVNSIAGNAAIMSFRSFRNLAAEGTWPSPLDDAGAPCGAIGAKLRR